MVLSLANEETYQKRLKKTTKQARSTGHNVSEKFKIKARLNIMVTNVPSEVLKTNEIRKVYAMRWQIELIFKTWKSLVTINEFNSKKIHRFECQLYGKLIWVILNLKIFNCLQEQMYGKYKILCSIWKYFRLIQNIQNFLIKAVKNQNQLRLLIKKLIDYAPKAIYLEKKKGKLALEHIINLLT
ncbi:transposase [Mongoliitalea daihaiensis]|uniref:transposase n=1 Tax=Mongoliitalea daihaiensis TaxID=2782006 RepID=UPI001F3838C6|nr:transposase [Mongoliitalea daihaiensis]UJP65622.1 transposase [Mongoliitalea daihaiensis]